MQSKKYLLSGLIALSLLIGPIAPQAASTQTGVTLSFSPETVTATTCGMVELSLDVAGVTEANPMTGYHLEVTYDRTEVEVISVENGDFLADPTETQLYEPTNTEDLVSDPTGRIVWGMVQQGVDGDPNPQFGGGSLIMITLQAKVANASTTFAVDLAGSMLVDWPEAQPIPFTASTKVVTTVGCAPTGLNLSPDSVKENELVGTTVGNFSATDADADETFTYSFIDDENYPDNDLFKIDENTLKTAVIFDHEEKDTRLIKVRVSDSTGLSYDKDFAIGILDINEVPIIDPIGPQSIVQNETLIFTAAATDPEDATLNWSLGASAPTGSTIDPATGEFSWDTTGFSLGDYIFDVCVSDGVYQVCETITVTVEAVPDPQPIKLYLPLILK